METATPARKIEDLPLWRLFVLFDDAEREAGPGSSTGRVLARIILEKLIEQFPHLKGRDAR